MKELWLQEKVVINLFKTKTLINNKILLSICIATYNRAEYISFTLDSIISQLTKDVEVVIVDGASTDNTKQVVERYLTLSDQIKYIRLLEKGGVDLDYCKSVEFASGEMCWLFTDDDLLKPNAIKKVLNAVKNKHSLVIVNAEVLTANFTKKISASLLSTKEDKLYSENDIDLLFNYVISFVSFIGCIVINRELWLKRDKLKYLGTEFIHVGIIFQNYLPSTVKVIGEPYIQVRYGNSQWSSRAFNIGMTKWTNLLSSFEIISPSIREKFIFKSFSKWLITMLLYRAKGHYSFNEYWNFKKGNIGIFRKLIALFILIIPCVLLNFLFLTYLKIFKINKHIAEYDLAISKCNKIYSHPI